MKKLFSFFSFTTWGNSNYACTSSWFFQAKIFFLPRKITNEEKENKNIFVPSMRRIEEKVEDKPQQDKVLFPFLLSTIHIFTYFTSSTRKQKVTTIKMKKIIFPVLQHHTEPYAIWFSLWWFAINDCVLWVWVCVCELNNPLATTSCKREIAPRALLVFHLRNSFSFPMKQFYDNVP